MEVSEYNGSWPVQISDIRLSLIGIPLQLTTDKGPEIGWQYAFQAALR